MSTGFNDNKKKREVTSDSPGGATIRCHFWNSVVLRQSRGLRPNALWRDISSCIGSSITHSCKRRHSCTSLSTISIHKTICGDLLDNLRTNQLAAGQSCRGPVTSSAANFWQSLLERLLIPILHQTFQRID